MKKKERKRKKKEERKEENEINPNSSDFENEFAVGLLNLANRLSNTEDPTEGPTTERYKIEEVDGKKILVDEEKMKKFRDIFEESLKEKAKKLDK
ncbi:MAG: hypothetical protein KAX18_01510 [Candidatus Lokiarchaeota archaeon]|nr:hypothetical protein [Candidatus Lokiarchaeota archaeon]